MLTVVSPAPPTAVLEVAPPTRRARGLGLVQATMADSVAISEGGELLAVAMLMDAGAREVELCLGLTPAARRRMLRLVRLAHLTLGRIADTGITVTASVHPKNGPGRRMAVLAGFRVREDGRHVWSGP